MVEVNNFGRENPCRKDWSMKNVTGFKMIKRFMELFQKMFWINEIVTALVNSEAAVPIFVNQSLVDLAEHAK